MSTSTLTRTSGASTGCGCGGGGGCGCGAAGTGQPLPVAGNCGGGSTGSCEARGLARPRFFAGQLLTEDDLQALSDYVVQKNRLHNRHFLGDGVVCGLQVQCHACGGGKLVVQAGHALDCCGNDLVLECAVELDVNAMVRDLRRNQLGGYDCGDPCADKTPQDPKNPKNPKPQDLRHYALYMRYVEQASDPVTPYDSGDACGGSSCEATRLREGVRFELRCGIEASAPADMLRQVKNCLVGLVRAEELTGALGRLSTGTGTPQDVASAREALLDHLDAMQPKAQCTLRAKAAAIQVPPEGADLQPATDKLLDAYLDIARDCVCNAILPPCPPCDDPGVLLATVCIAGCEVVSICNLERKLVLTGPNLRYWLPVDVIGDALESLCCPDDACVAESPAEAQAPGANSKVQPQALEAAQPSTAATASSPQINAKDPDMVALRTQLADYALRRLDLTALDASRLTRLGETLGTVLAAGALDRFPAVRMLRRSDPRGLLSNEVADTRAFRDMKKDLDAEQLKRFDAARLELQQLHTQSTEKLAAENKDLRVQLDALVEKLNKLETSVTKPKK